MAQLRARSLPTRLYRYRSLAKPGVLDQEIDGITKRYLYCASFMQMNDPLEGLFVSEVHGRGHDEKAQQTMIEIKGELGLACLTETQQHAAMWAYYAGGYNGICIAYSTRALKNGLPAAALVTQIVYEDLPPSVVSATLENPRQAAVRVLSQKTSGWAHEREWRVLAPRQGQIRIAAEKPVTDVYLGSRVTEADRARFVRSVAPLEIKIHAMADYSLTFQQIRSRKN